MINLAKLHTMLDMELAYVRALARLSPVERLILETANPNIEDFTKGYMSGKQAKGKVTLQEEEKDPKKDTDYGQGYWQGYKGPHKMAKAMLEESVFGKLPSSNPNWKAPSETSVKFGKKQPLKQKDNDWVQKDTEKKGKICMASLTQLLDMGLAYVKAFASLSSEERFVLKAANIEDFTKDFVAKQGSGEPKGKQRWEWQKFKSQKPKPLKPKAKAPAK